MVVSAIQEAAHSAVKAEQSRMTTQIRNLSEEQRRVADSVKLLLKARDKDQATISEIVETAKHVTTKAAQRAGAADAARVSAMKGAVDEDYDTEDLLDQDALPLISARHPTARRSTGPTSTGRSISRRTRTIRRPSRPSIRSSPIVASRP